MHPSALTSKRPPLSPHEAWLSDGRQVLHFQPLRYSRFSQALVLTSGELIPGQPPLLKCRKEITREQAIQLWRQKRKQGWQPCEPQWTPPPALKPPVHRPAASMGATGLPPCC